MDFFSKRNNRIDKDRTSEIQRTPLELEKLESEARLGRLHLDSSSGKNISNSKQIKPPYSRMGTGGRNQYQSIFRIAHFLGLFPVSGLHFTSKGKSDGERGVEGGANGVQFRPASWRLLATFIFILAVLLLEGLGIIHMLVAADPYPESYVHFVTYRHGTIASDLAPVLHYGATVSI